MNDIKQITIRCLKCHNEEPKLVKVGMKCSECGSYDWKRVYSSSEKMRELGI